MNNIKLAAEKYAENFALPAVKPQTMEKLANLSYLVGATSDAARDYHAQQQSNLSDKEIQKLAEKVWEQDQKTNPTPVNPYAFTYGFKFGYKVNPLHNGLSVGVWTNINPKTTGGTRHFCEVEMVNGNIQRDIKTWHNDKWILEHEEKAVVKWVDESALQSQNSAGVCYSESQIYDACLSFYYYWYNEKGSSSAKGLQVWLSEYLKKIKPLQTTKNSAGVKTKHLVKQANSVVDLEKSVSEMTTEESDYAESQSNNNKETSFTEEDIKKVWKGTAMMQDALLRELKSNQQHNKYSI